MDLTSFASYRLCTPDYCDIEISKLKISNFCLRDTESTCISKMVSQGATRRYEQQQNLLNDYSTTKVLGKGKGGILACNIVGISKCSRVSTVFHIEDREAT